MRLDRSLLQFTLPGPPFPSTIAQPLGIAGVYGHITLHYVTEVSTSLELTSNVERGMLPLFFQSIGRFLRGLMFEGGSFGRCCINLLLPLTLSPKTVSLVSLGIQTGWRGWRMHQYMPGVGVVRMRLRFGLEIIC